MTSPTRDWPALIGESVLLRQQAHDLDPDVNPYTAPRLAADDAQLDGAEHRVGHALDPLHRQLLAHGDGWDQFFVYCHLFASAELGGATWREAEALLDVFYSDGPVPDDLPDRRNVYVMCANPGEVEDLFVVWRLGPVHDGGRPVSWLAGEEVQRFDNVWDFLGSVNAYLRKEIGQSSSTAP